MNHSMPEINTLLKQLRLSHMAEHLAERNRQAIESKLTYPEFLALLLQDETLYRNNKKLIVRLKRAGFQSEKTIENFNFDFNPKINRAYLQDLAACRFVAEKSPVLIVGPCGTGKSHIAQAIGHCAIRQGIDVFFTSQSRLFNMLQAAKATHSFNKKMAQLIKIPLLIIDDFGIKPLRTPQDEDFHDLIAERYENASTIVTSNLEFNEWGDAFPNRLLAAATLDRLRHDAYRIVLEGNSYRSSRELKSTKKTGGK
jgi:DNA replication protein DnaC